MYVVWNTRRLFNCSSDNFQVSLPYISTEITFDLEILILILYSSHLHNNMHTTPFKLPPQLDHMTPTNILENIGNPLTRSLRHGISSLLRSVSLKKTLVILKQSYSSTCCRCCYSLRLVKFFFSFLLTEFVLRAAVLLYCVEDLCGQLSL